MTFDLQKKLDDEILEKGKISEGLNVLIKSLVKGVDDSTVVIKLLNTKITELELKIKEADDWQIDRTLT